MTEYERKRKQLIPYIQIYLSKKLRMEIVFIGIVNQLKRNQPISEKQFNSLIKFLERETPFVRMDRDQIREHFSPLITNKITKENYNGNTLCEFFVWSQINQLQCPKLPNHQLRQFGEIQKSE